MKINAKKIVCVFLTAFMMAPSIPVTASSYMSTSQEGIDLIKEAEGYAQYKFWDYSQWSIGYGTGVSEDAYPDGISEPEAEQLLRKAVVKYENYVNSFADKYSIDLKQNQFDALVSLTYNMGNIWNVYDEFDLKECLITGSENHSFLEITKGFGEWRKAGGSVLQGLVTRREEEAALFLSDRTDNKGEVWRVNTENGVNLRKAADVSSKKLGYMDMNTIFRITEKKAGADGSLWGKTKYDGEECWCALDYSRYIAGGPMDYSEEKPEENSEKWVITSDNGVRLRKGPGLNYDGLTVIPKNAKITVTATAEADGYLWGKVSYSGKSGWCVLNYAEREKGQQQELPGKTLDKIYLASAPKKKSYSEGEKLDLKGIEVKAVYSDKSEETVSDITVSGFESIPGKHTVTVTYMNKTATFDVKVKGKELESIEIAQEPKKSVYKQGEEIDILDMVVNAVYDNGMKEAITDYTINGFDSEEAGIKNVEVEYEGFKAHFIVMVAEKQVKNIEIAKLPNKLEYIMGQEFSDNGMIVEIVYDNGDSEKIENYSISGFNSAKAGEQKIFVGFNGMYKTFKVTVSEPNMNELPGDLDGDNERTIYDLVLLNRFVDKGIADFDTEYSYLADINGDGTADRKDVELLSEIVSEQ